MSKSVENRNNTRNISNEIVTTIHFVEYVSFSSHVLCNLQRTDGISSVIDEFFKANICVSICLPVHKCSYICLDGTYVRKP